MYQYPKIEDESILLDKDCKRLLRRTSRKHIIEEVINKLENKKNKENCYESFKNNKNNKNITFFEVLLMIFTCNIYKYEKYD